MTKQRIQKVLAKAGIASRRASEEMILDGRIAVNGDIVVDLPCFVDPEQDDIRIDGERLKNPEPESKKYFIVNKPRGVVCTQSDPQGRPRVIDMVPQIEQRVYCVGRLDKDSTGLVLLTNDGEFCNRITHPRYGVEKTYVVEVRGRMEGEQIEQLKKGGYIDGKRTQRLWLKVLRKGRSETVLEIRLREGRNREIRRLLARVGHKVMRLKRVAIGPVTDRGLKIGSVRPLKRNEIRKLLEEAESEGRPPRRNKARKGSK
ncbi:MAG: pseudouridine synthase [Phycisphaerae bacterium]